MLVGPEAATRTWIHDYRYLEKLYQYFAASDFALIQSGYGKTVELSALGVPFIAIPLDYHFEQEYLMAHRLKNDGLGKLITLRNHSPEEIAKEAQESLKQQGGSIPVDDGREIASIILETHRNP
jgi:UDP-N-acetylglucosamine:LPS N-acetylglucosamine transferase